MDPITAEVARRGRVRFDQFMALALYDATAGYYTRPRSGPGPAGPGGDFLTAPTASPLFARTLGRLLTGLATALGRPVTLVELAAGEGILLERVIAGLGDERSKVLAAVIGVETAEWARGRMSERVGEAAVHARLHDAVRPVGPVVMVVSELYDALPVRRAVVRSREGRLELREMFVEVRGDQLAYVEAEPEDTAIEDYLAGHRISLAEGQVAEVRPAARELHADHLRWCGDCAVALVIDYGMTSRTLYSPRGRLGGTLAGYRRHALTRDVLATPGEIDITAHVNFDDLTRAASECSWDQGELRPLGSFLALHGALDLLPEAVRSGAPLTPEEWAELSAAKRLLAPGGMASDLKVLAQGKGTAWQAYRVLATPPPSDA